LVFSLKAAPGQAAVAKKAKTTGEYPLPFCADYLVNAHSSKKVLLFEAPFVPCTMHLVGSPYRELFNKFY
jgi:hypothetical protein